MVANHRPGVTASATRPRHGFESRFAVGMAGMPMTSAAQPLWMKIPGTGAKGFGHLGAAEVALAGGTSTKVFTPLKALDRGVQRILTSATDELGDQGSEPVRCLSK